MNSDGWRIPRTLTALVGTAIAIAAVSAAVYFGPLAFSPPVGAVENHGDCTGGIVSISPDSGDLATYDAGTDIVTGVCIKSGANMFGGDHSQVFTQDTANIASCYGITGIGTSNVTVQRTGTPSSTCQAISHIDVIVGTPTPTPTPTSAATPTPTPTPTATAAATSPGTATPTPAALDVAQGPSALPATGGTPTAGASGSLPWVAAVFAGLALATAGALWAHSGRRGR